MIMNTNEQLITDFYTAFQNKDYVGMQKCYSDRALFSDAVFKDLNAQQVRKMWEMLIKRGQDLQLTFENIKANNKEGGADWAATYTFTKTGRKVVNHIHASFVFEDGKILKHTDNFNFRRWAKQAFGPIAGIPIFTIFLKRKVQKIAMKSLEEYMA
jgi:ketosteroid isomerase-like protein